MKIRSLRLLALAALLLAPLVAIHAADNDRVLSPVGGAPAKAPLPTAAPQPAAAPAPVGQTQTFENGMPTFVGVAKGRVAISESRVQDGRHSLRWDWVPGDTLTFKTGPLGKVNVNTGYGGYSRSAFSIHVFTETVGDGALTFKWMAGDKVGARFEFPLVFKGWQRVCYHYSWDSKLKDRKGALLENTDRIVVEAPQKGAGGTVYFDSVDFNKPVDFREGREPVATLWKPFDIAADCKDPAILAPPTPKELAAVTQIVTALAAPGNRTVTEKEALAVEQKLEEKYALKRRPDGTVAGNNVPNFSASVSSQLLWIANAWRGAGPTTAPKVRERIGVRRKKVARSGDVR